MSYQAYNPMLASATKKTGWWRLPLGLCAAFLAVAILSPLLMSLIGNTEPELIAISWSADGDQNVGSSHGGLLIVLASFALLLLAALIAAKRLHCRSVSDVTGPSHQLRRDFRRVFSWVAVAAAALLFLPMGEVMGSEAPTQQYPLTVWAMWLPLGALGLMIQVTAEEVFFRGYLQTQLVAATKSYWLGMGGGALLFGAGHYSMAADGIAAFFPVLWATAFGLVAGDLMARTGSLGAPIAVHFVNNALALFAAPTAGQLSGFGLWIHDIDLTAAYTNPILIAVEALSLLILWLIARIALKR